MTNPKKPQCITFTYRRKRYYCYGSTLSKASEKTELLKRQLRTAGEPDDSNISLNRYFDNWIMIRQDSIRASTERSIRETYKRLSRYEPDGDGRRLGQIPLYEISKGTILKLQNHLVSTVSSSTANDTISLLRRILKDAVNDRLIDWNPCSGVASIKRKEPAIRENRHRALTVDETKLFFKYARASCYYDFYRFLLHSGVRCGEAGALTASDFKRNVIEIRRTITRGSKGLMIGDDVKTGAGRRDIPLTDELRMIIRAQKRKNTMRGKVVSLTEPGQCIFLSPRGKLINCANVNSDIKRICLMAGLEVFTAHAFRDTFATRAIESGMNPKTLQDILGHSSYGITMSLYAHVMPSTKAQEMEHVNISIV